MDCDLSEPNACKLVELDDLSIRVSDRNRCTELIGKFEQNKKLMTIDNCDEMKRKCAICEDDDGD